MKVVVAIDSLKGSLSSVEAGMAIKDGILKVCDADIIVKPLADGGEGTVQALLAGMNGKEISLDVTGPLGKKVTCVYGVLEESKTAIIEMAEAAGIKLVPDELLNPLNTSTYGVGEVIKDAINLGCRNFIIGLGGSATNDGGIGMLQALGYVFYDDQGIPVGPEGKELIKIVGFRTEGALKELRECNFRVACDVINPLYGPIGAARVFGPQKGATPEIVNFLDKALMKYAGVVKAILGKDIVAVPGTGAAGGLGYAFLAFLNGKLESGIRIILDEIKLEEDIRNADFVVTGEGRLDFQTAMGKAPIGVAKLAKKYNKIVIAFAGGTTDDAKQCNEEGIDAYFSILQLPMTLETAMGYEMAKKNMTSAATQAFRLIMACK